MLTETSTSIMDTVFAAGTPQSTVQLLRIIQDFLASQGKLGIVPSAGAIAIDQSRELAMDELVGNVDGFADSGYVHGSSFRSRRC